MIKLRKLYTQPATIEPVAFDDGLNLILGEEDDSSSKTNGVGKSLCIEFINFALLKRKGKSRVSLIPKSSFSASTLICLDFDIDGVPYTIKRSLEESEQPTLIDRGVETKFLTLEDAAKFLTEKLFARSERSYPTFRAMLGPLIRDERSEFKSLIRCYDTNETVPENYAPHLHLLGVDIDLYAAIRTCIHEIDEINKDIKRIKDNVKLLRQKEVVDARSDLNELDSEVSEIEKSIDALENIAGYDLVKDDILRLEELLENLRRKKHLLRSELSRMQPILKKVQIEVSEVKEFYDQLKDGLGQLVAKDLSEVYSFKERIDDFQNQLINERRQDIRNEVNKIDKEISTIDRLYSEKLSVLDQEGNLRNLKQTYAAFREKADEAGQLRSFIDKFDQLEKRKREVKTDKETNLLRLQSEIQEAQTWIKGFEKTILELHEHIQGNRRASFDIRPTNKKQVIEIDMRIDDDGSHSVDRLKVFLYDISLFLNKETAVFHPGLLIHDNIFDVDQDTLIKSLNYLDERADYGEGQQYILTLNADRLVLDERGTEILSHLATCTRARFTKNNRFLKTKYQESH